MKDVISDIVDDVINESDLTLIILFGTEKLFFNGCVFVNLDNFPN